MDYSQFAQLSGSNTSRAREHRKTLTAVRCSNRGKITRGVSSVLHAERRCGVGEDGLCWRSRYENLITVPSYNRIRNVSLDIEALSLARTHGSCGTVLSDSIESSQSAQETFTLNSRNLYARLRSNLLLDVRRPDTARKSNRGLPIISWLSHHLTGIGKAVRSTFVARRRPHLLGTCVLGIRTEISSLKLHVLKFS